MRLSDDLRTATNADGGVILDLRRGKMFRLNPTAAAILELLGRGYTEQRIAAEMEGLCGVEAQLALRDVQAFLSSLAANGLLAQR